MERFINQKVLISKKDSSERVEGIVCEIAQEENMITVKTETGERFFTFTSVLNNAIVFVDEELQCIAKPFFSELKQCYEDLKNAEDEKAIEEAKNNYICRIRRDIGDSNVAFKCTFCNGGSSSSSIGFRGPCSSELRQVNVKNRAWCGSKWCRCRKLLAGEIDQKEFDEKLSSTIKEEFLCYESKMLIEWVCYAGMEEKTGLPMALNKAQVGSLAVLTTRPVIDGYEVPQEKTQIFGVFLIAKHNDNSSIGGSVSAHPKYRIELTPEESKKILFWKYHKNFENPTKAFWGTGLHRYLSDMECCQILSDIADVITDADKKALAVELLEKFKKETGITNIDKLDGAIK